MNIFFLYQYSCHETLTILILHIYPTRSSIFGQLISRHFLINPNKLLFSIHENYNINMAYNNQMIATYIYSHLPIIFLFADPGEWNLQIWRTNLWFWRRSWKWIDSRRYQGQHIGCNRQSQTPDEPKIDAI